LTSSTLHWVTLRTAIPFTCPSASYKSWSRPLLLSPKCSSRTNSVPNRPTVTGITKIQSWKTHRNFPIPAVEKHWSLTSLKTKTYSRRSSTALSITRPRQIKQWKLFRKLRSRLDLEPALKLNNTTTR
jgi:hypothetical protein